MITITIPESLVTALIYLAIFYGLLLFPTSLLAWMRIVERFWYRKVLSKEKSE